MRARGWKRNRATGLRLPHTSKCFKWQSYGKSTFRQWGYRGREKFFFIRKFLSCLLSNAIQLSKTQGARHDRNYSLRLQQMSNISTTIYVWSFHVCTMLFLFSTNDNNNKKEARINIYIFSGNLFACRKCKWFQMGYKYILRCIAECHPVYLDTLHAYTPRRTHVMTQ